tara:strand:- start:35387 stop:38788 length:3402 start_codon:yes stop_codon:yes gene_type:complete
MDEDDKMNISKYTDKELYNILDITNPTDRELEARIIHLIRKYANMQNESGDRLAKFFTDIYDHFFQDEDEEDEEDDKKAEEKEEEKEEEDEKEKSKNTISSVQTFEYSADKLQLNPLLKQTIKRVISIDSQYRDKSIYGLSTNFTFDLSEPLRDVVSLKLYSIQIPYTWYTISKSFGSNFFYLKGNVDGINNGSHDYKIGIPSGNYSASELTTAINGAFTTVFNTYTDVSFGATNLYYNPANARTTLTIDIQKVYNENYYDLVWSSWTPSKNVGMTNTQLNEYRLQTIPSYLGFNKVSYEPYIITSSQTYKPTSLINTESTNLFLLDTNNNYFQVIQYVGPEEKTATNTVKTHQINLLETGYYNREQVISIVNNAIVRSKLFSSDSQIERVDITESTTENDGFTYFKMTLKIDRMKVLYEPNTKFVIRLPEGNAPQTQAIGTVWTQVQGYNSCFYFEFSENDLCDLVSESQPVLSSFVIDNSVNIIFTCNSPAAYVNEENNIRVGITEGNYSLNQLTERITQDMIDVGFFEDGTEFDIIDSFLNLNIEQKKTFDETTYSIVIDEAESSLFEMFNMRTDLSGRDLSVEEIYFDGSFNVNRQGYTITQSRVLDYLPNGTAGNKNDTQRSIDLDLSQQNTFFNYNDMLNFIQQTINTHTYETVLSSTRTDIQAPFSQTYFTSQLDPTGTYVDVSMNIRIAYNLTHLNYDVRFSDNGQDMTEATNIWSNFGIDESYNLLDNIQGSNPYSSIIGNSPLNANSIELYDSSNNFFYINPYVYDSGGAYTHTGGNNIKITIPADKDGTTYTNSTLLSAINAQFDNNPITFGSRAMTYLNPNNNREFTKIRLNINKIYTSEDYKLVFYDAISFSRCFSGSQSVQNATWDTTLGWIFGFRDYIEYVLRQSNQRYDDNTEEYKYLSSVDGEYNYNIVYDDLVEKDIAISNTSITNRGGRLVKKSTIELTSDTTVNTNLYSYFLISLDDYNQNHLNDGLVTVTRNDPSIPIPEYSKLATKVCDPVTGEEVDETSTSMNQNNLTNNQLYALNQAEISHKNNVKTSSPGPYIKDLFGLIPIKPGINGKTYVEFGGSLQNQERLYFGPVNIRKMTIQLLNDRGDLVDLNRSDWSFSFICEQLYKSTSS